MTDSNSNDWKDESTIKQEEFTAGYEVESAKRSPDRDGSNDELDYNQSETTASRTTFYTTQEWEERNEPCKDQRFATKGQKYARLWRFNAGFEFEDEPFDYTDEDCHIVDKFVRDRTQFVHAVCDRLGLSERVANEAKSIAATVDPLTFNFNLGGFDTYLPAVVLKATNECGEVGRIDRSELEAIKNEFDVSNEKLAKGTSKLD